jgi:hypothetical protein
MTTFSFFLIILLVFGGIYISNPRVTKNTLYALFPKYRREFVVVWFIKNASRKSLKYYIIPDESGYATIEKGKYNLESKNALPDEDAFNNRLHFLVEEGNPIPIKAEIQHITNSKVLFTFKGKIYFKGAQGYKLSDPDKDRIKNWAFTIQRALVTTWFKILYAEVKQWAFILAMAGFIIAALVGYYEYTVIQSMNPMIQAIYQHTIIENASVLIKQGQP